MVKTEWEKWRETVAGMLRENEESFFNGKNWAVFWATSEAYGVEWHCDMLHGAMDRKGSPTAWLTETDRDLAEDIPWEDEDAVVVDLASFTGYNNGNNGMEDFSGGKDPEDPFWLETAERIMTNYAFKAGGHKLRDAVHNLENKPTVLGF